MNEKIILVFGATGQQGSAAVKHLITSGWKVRAFTRNVSSDKALKLKQLGAELFQGDMEKVSSVNLAMQGVYGVFSVLPPSWEPTPESEADEERIGKSIADLAQKNNIQHFIYGSVGGADAQSHFRSMPKWAIEQYILSLDLPSTILRPATFMENYLNPMTAGVQNGTIAQAFDSNRKIPLIAVDDVGAFVALIFSRPKDYLGKTIELAGDTLTPLQIVDAIGRATNRTIPYVQIPMETLSQHNEILAGVFQWLNDKGHEVDISVLRAQLPKLKDFHMWIDENGKEKYENLFQTKIS